MTRGVLPQVASPLDCSFPVKPISLSVAFSIANGAVTPIQQCCDHDCETDQSKVEFESIDDHGEVSTTVRMMPGNTFGKPDSIVDL